MADPAKPEAEGGAPSSPPTAPLDHRAALIDVLGLAQDVQDEDISHAIGVEKEMRAAAEKNPPADESGVTEKFNKLQTEHESLVKDHEALKGEHQKMLDENAAAEKTRRESEADAALGEYDMPDETKAAMREHMIADPEKAKTLLAGMKKKEAAPNPQSAVANPQSKQPPVHTPTGKEGGQGKMSDQEKTEKGNALIKEIRGKGKFKDYSSAREEARRQKPELFS